MSTTNAPSSPLEFYARVAPFTLLHVVCLGAIWTGVSTTSLILCAVLFWIRMFGITAGYHRYFSHRSYKMGRIMQFLMSFLAASSAQRGVLWWAGHHRHHHKHSDDPEDLHSPLQRGFWMSHLGWFLIDPKSDPTCPKMLREYKNYPEILWTEKYHAVPVLFLVALAYLIDGMTGAIVGFLWSTVLLWHATYTINSLCHVFGSRRYETTDTSRNNVWLALLTLGEGWHNNHHYYQASVRQGFYWWEIDITYYVLKMMSWVGLVWDLREPPARVKEPNPRPQLPRGVKQPVLTATTPALTQESVETQTTTTEAPPQEPPKALLPALQPRLEKAAASMSRAAESMSKAAETVGKAAESVSTVAWNVTSHAATGSATVPKPPQP